MSWQDDLRRLDEDLTAGRVTAEEYRYRRDMLLAQSASGMDPNASSGGADQAPAAWSAGASPQQAPDAGEGAASGGDRTQVVQPVGPLVGQGAAAGGDRTQVVQPGSPPAGFPAQPGPAADNGPERTQLVRPGQPGPVPAQGQQGSWGAPQGGQPDWGQGGWGQGAWSSDNGGSESPLWADTAAPAPGSFSPTTDSFAGGGGKKSKKIVWAVIGIVVLVVIVVAAVLVFKPAANSGGANQATGPTSGTTASPTTTKPAGPLAKLPGTVTPNSVSTFDDAMAAGFLVGGANSEVSAFDSGKPTTTYFGQSLDGDKQILVLIVKEDSTGDANSVTSQLSQLEVTYGLQPNPNPPAGTYVESGRIAKGPLVRAEYASGSYAVWIEVQGQNAASDGTSEGQEMTNVLQAQLAKLPANHA